jgi:hypothetical protein
MGYEVEQRPYGVLARLAGKFRVILASEEIDESLVSDLVATRAEVWVEDRARAGRLAPALSELGYASGPATTYLALVGDVRARVRGDLALVAARDEVDFARRKLTYFADGALPSEDELAREVATRRAEREESDFYFVTLAGEVTGILAAYRGEDATTYLLATDVARRGRGVGAAALAAWVASTPARSHVINALDGGRPEGLYRRLGFSDEVYWYRRFEASGEE